MWQVLGAIFGLLALALGVLYAVGRQLSPDHVVTATLRLARSPDEVHALVRDIGAWNTWDRGVTRIERLEPQEGCECIRMFMGGNSFVLKRLSENAPKTLTLRAVDDHGFFEGRWEYELAVVEGRTTLRLTEYGSVKPAVPRAILKYFADPAMYLKRHLKEVANRFSEPADIFDAHRIS